MSLFLNTMYFQQKLSFVEIDRKRATKVSSLHFGVCLIVWCVFSHYSSSLLSAFSSHDFTSLPPLPPPTDFTKPKLPGKFDRLIGDTIKALESFLMN